MSVEVLWPDLPVTPALPVAAALAGTEAGASAVPSPLLLLPGRRPEPAKRVLLVEDEPDHAFLVIRQLASAWGSEIDVVRASTLAEAGERLGQGGIWSVLLDLSLPDSTGLETLRAVRRLDAVTPVVVLTGLDDDGVGLAALQAGAQDYLVKGRARPEELIRALRFASERVDRQRAEQDRARLAGQLAEAQRIARLGSFEWDLATDQVVWSDELCRLFGLSPGVTLTRLEREAVVAARIHPEDLPAVRRLWHRATHDAGPLTLRLRIRGPDGALRWLQGTLSATELDATGRPTKALGILQDVTEQRLAEEALSHQALCDALTGLANRALLLDRLSRALAATQRDATMVAVVFVDLDRFKWVNDSLGHSAGDELLVAVAGALRGALRPADTLARIGGDEFLVLCEGLSHEREASVIAARLTNSLGLFRLGSREVSVTASMGIATGGVGADPDTLIANADMAMYRAKERGRDRCEVFDAEMGRQARDYLDLADALSHAVEHDEVEVHYQPLMDLRTGRVSATEALVRWNHPRRGLLAPADFVPMAEETGLIVPLGAHVLGEACRQVAVWNRSSRCAAPLDVSVNVSARQLASDGLARLVSESLEDAGLEPQRLHLEVTETALMADIDASSAVLGELRHLGVKVSIDDFGTGYASLTYLSRLPVDSLKVDRSFVARLLHDPTASTIVTGVIWLARALHLDVVAEGVESQDQLAALQELGCQLAQGYLWAEPAPPHAFLAWLERLESHGLASHGLASQGLASQDLASQDLASQGRPGAVSGLDQP